MALDIIGQQLAEFAHELRPFGARPDKAHIPLEHAPALRQFVDPRGPHELSDAGHPRVVHARELRAVAFGIGLHRAELEQLEFLAVMADSGLAIESRAPAIELNEQGENDDERRGQQQDQRGGGDIEAAFERARNRPAGRKAIGKDQPAGVQRIEIDTARLAFEKAREIVHRNAGHLYPQQILERKRIAALFQREHDFGRVEPIDMLRQIGDILAQHGLRNGCVFGHGDETDDAKAAFLTQRKFAQTRRARSGPEHHNSPLEAGHIDRAVEQETQPEQGRARENQGEHQRRTPECRTGEEEADERNHDDRHRQADQQSRQRIARRPQGFGPVQAHCRKRRYGQQREYHEAFYTLREEARVDPGLQGTQAPSRFAAQDQQ